MKGQVYNGECNNCSNQGAYYWNADNCCMYCRSCGTALNTQGGSCIGMMSKPETKQEIADIRKSIADIKTLMKSNT